MLQGFMARANGIPALELYNLAQRKNRKLVLCGHSLGGAVGTCKQWESILCSQAICVLILP
jgi:hypothetical protein